MCWTMAVFQAIQKCPGLVYSRVNAVQQTLFQCFFRVLAAGLIGGSDRVKRHILRVAAITREALYIISYLSRALRHLDIPYDICQCQIS